MNNLLYIAAAGSGKTTKLVKTAIEKSLAETVLITTFTDTNEQEIRNKFYQYNSAIPKNVTILTWFSLLVQHGIKPYQDSFNDVFSNIEINGILPLDLHRKNFMKESDFKHYVSHDKLYSDKLAKFVVKSDEATNGRVIERISRIFKNIYIDEAQDLAGYDFEVLRLLFNSNANIILACDPRQATYQTHHENKNSKYSNGKILDYLNDNKPSFVCRVDKTSLNLSYRCNNFICDYASKLHPAFEAMKSFSPTNNKKDDGVFLIEKSQIEYYLSTFNVMQLRYNKKSKCHEEFRVMNFGESKGLTFDNVLIYPTKNIEKWIENHNEDLADETRSKFYVALTRAKFKVCILWDKKSCSANDINFINFTD